MHKRIPLSTLILFLLSIGTAAYGEPMNQKKPDKKATSAAASKTSAPALPKGILRTAFGKTKEGTPVDLYSLSNEKGMVVKITNFGAIVTEMHVADRNGKIGNIILGFDNLSQYLGSHPYFGAIVGRVGNRIAKGKFSLKGKEYTLATNNGPNHLHGGLKGFDKVVWQAEPISISKEPSLKLTYVSPDGEEGYPGTLTSTVIYTLTNKNELELDFTAASDKATILNLTNHSYFNLAGPGTGDILSHVLTLTAGRFTPVDDDLIPTGEMISVKGSPFDFLQPQPIGSRIAMVKGGYDINYVLDSGGSDQPTMAARVRESKSGRVMEVLTTQPGIQFYTGNFLDGTIKGIGGIYKQHYGFCLETQHFPDSINQPQFPSTVLEPGQVYHYLTIFRFSTER